ncbi:MAG: hypothetical protein LUQ04_02000 [Methanoregula sp.]|nr:hypothetical protein [Methanoregula sp.]
MDKKAVMYAVGAMAIILIVALVIKPIATGQPLNTGLSIPTTIETINPVETATSSARDHLSVPVTAATSPAPTTIPTWDANVKKVEFVDPSSYGISMNLSLPNGTRIDSVPRNTSRVLFAKITGQYSATTQVMHMPFPYWEIWYSVEPAGKMGGKDQKLSSSTVTGPEGSGISKTVIQGSFSVITPTFTLQVMDADDPNRFVRTITPPGGLDSTLWKSGTGSGIDASDPRPWKEKIFEGRKNYYFVIYAQSVDSYTIEIRVPAEYIGKY